MRQETHPSPLLRTTATTVATVGVSPTQQPAKPTCPACQVAPASHHHSTLLLDSLCEYHSATLIPPRILYPPRPQPELFPLSLSTERSFAKSSDNVPPILEHVEYTFFDTHNPDLSKRLPSPEFERRSRASEHNAPTIDTGSAVAAAGLHSIRHPRSFSPHSSSSSSPSSPRSERDSSPSLSSSPVEHFPSWTNRDARALAETSPVSSPYTDITRLRVDSQGRGSLYPGSIFCGSQRSGANSYDVTVTIVNTDFASSVLCGYLRIQNLTQEYPELTTYFHAEIIGSRYGFVTAEEWGATESDDITHWSRFPAFRSVRNQLKRPGLTMRDRERNTIFMRWKERFLVPDHKTKEISGASFAGFYYVAVTEATEEAPASITAFYFHPQSEPYQQLSLHHVPEDTTSSFEFC